MARQGLHERLAAGERLLLDGATGSELQLRGVNVSKGVSADGNRLGAWSATAMGDAPEIVRAVHEDYLKAGADILTTNSFWTNSFKLGLVGLADEAEAYTRLAGEIAIEARDRLKPDALVAGGMAPPHGGLEPVDPVDLPREFAMQGRVLAEAGVDLLLLEYIGYVDDCVAAVDAVAPTGLPVVLGLRHVTPEGTMQAGEAFEDLVAALGDRSVDAILLMCTDPATTTTCLELLRDAYGGAIGAYANIGYGQADPATKDPKSQFHSIDTGDCTPERYAEFGRAWLDLGAQIIGGCCATRPAHIAALRRMMDGWGGSQAA
jgi:S-methylmethionine-dependent homocysteine/selenocysteine methylase